MAGAARDAIDVDFCEVDLDDVRFRACGNDCFDLSGSTGEARRLRIEGVGDKGLSIGEATRLQLVDVEVQGASTGVAVKDGSVLTGQQLRFADSAIGVALYVKKPAFGPPRASLRGLRMRAVDAPVLVEHGSQLHLDGALVPDDARAVLDRVTATAAARADRPEAAPDEVVQGHPDDADPRAAGPKR